MKLEMVAVYDTKAQAYGTPNFVVSLGIAIRSFADEVNRPDANNVLYRHPDDFVLYHLGSYDDTTATFDQLPHAKELARGKEHAVRDNG